MNDPAKKPRELNSQLTKTLVELHAKGYHFDFFPLNQRWLLCLQNNRVVLLDTVYIYIVGQVYDQLSRSFKYIHTIDTGDGEQGVMVAEGIYTQHSA